MQTMQDPAHFMIPECLRQTEDEILLVCSRKQMSIYDTSLPPQIMWDEVLVRRTVDRRTGLVTSEENVYSFSVEESRRLSGHAPKEILTVFFYLDGERSLSSLNVVKATKGKSLYLSLTNDLFNLYSNDSKLIPRSTYRKMREKELELSPLVLIHHKRLLIGQENLSQMSLQLFNFGSLG